MHERYTCPHIAEIWSNESKFQNWFDIEEIVCEAQAKYGNIPKKAVDDISKGRWICVETGNFVEKINEIEKTTKHDVLAFLTHCSNMIGPSAKYIHMGMTSQDLLDTCNAMQIKQSLIVIEGALKDIVSVLEQQAKDHKNTICVGRSHGIHAEPTTFGLKLLGHYRAFQRCLELIGNSYHDICRIKCSGAVGTYSVIDPKIEEYLADELGMLTEDVSTQVVPRDRFALLMSYLGIIGGCIENLAVEIRHLQRTEVGEVIEQFTKGQKGSSAMPHKKNPILTENLTGLARLIKSAVAPSLDNIALWHERDISHSSVERITLPDTFSYVSFALTRLTKVVKNMEVNTERMQENLNITGGLVYSQQVLLFLINNKGLTREQAYKEVQTAAHGDGAFKDNLIANNVLSMDEVNDIFNVGYYTKNVDYIFHKVFSTPCTPYELRGFA
jgi:adenylosuccinate lyase